MRTWIDRRFGGATGLADWAAVAIVLATIFTVTWAIAAVG